MSGIEPTDREMVSKTFGIAEAMAAEIVYENDECYWRGVETPENRWQRMREWIDGWIKALEESSDGSM